MRLRLLSYNIRFGGWGRQKEIAEVVDEIAPDIVIFQEATAPQVIEGVAEATGMPHWASKHDHSVGYISRVPIAHHEWHHPRVSKHPFLEVQPEGSDFRIFGLHLRSMFARWTERQREREIRALMRSIEKYEPGFHVLVGDFNTLAPGELLDSSLMPTWIQALIWISGRNIQRDTIKAVLEADYVDAYRILHPDVKGYTFPVPSPHLRLDYVFLPSTHTDCLESIEVIEEPPVVDRASDHYPLLAVLEIG